MHPTLAHQLRWLGLDDSAPPADVETWQQLLERLDASFHETVPSREIDHYRHLYARLPVALWTQDYTAVVEKLDALRVKGVRNLRAYLGDNVDELVELVKLIRVVDVNEAAVALNGVERSVLLGPIKAEMLDDESIRSFVGQFEALWHGQTSTHYSFSSSTFSGDRLEALFYWIVETTAGEPDFENVLVTMIDITALKETEERLARQIQTKDRFLASVSHELRTPLTSVYAGAETLREGWNELPAEIAKELVETIARESGELAAMIDDLLVAARGEIGEVPIVPEDTAIGELVNVVLAVLRPQESGKKVEVDVGEASVFGDPLRIRQIVRNLVTNAIRYGGSTMRISADAAGDRRFLVVEDDGPGVPIGRRESIFTPYETAHKRSGVTGSVGIGLTVARQLSRLMGGDLRYEHRNGWTRFILELPAATGAVDIAS